MHNRKSLNLTMMLFVSVFSAGALTMPLTANAADDVYKIDTFTDVDVDKSGYLANGEYLDYAFGRADWDNDGYLEDTEWTKYTEVYYDPYELDYDTYTAYDTDGDGFIDRSEFNEFPTVDLYAAWDYNDDDLIDSDDWDKVTVHYTDYE